MSFLNNIFDSLVVNLIYVLNNLKNEKMESLSNLPDNLGKLRELCLKNKISYRGTKKQLKEKLIKNGKTTYSEAVEKTYFVGLKLPELRNECMSRGITHSK